MARTQRLRYRLPRLLGRAHFVDPRAGSVGATPTAVLIDGHGLFVRKVSKRRRVHGGQVSAAHEERPIGPLPELSAKGSGTRHPAERHNVPEKLQVPLLLDFRLPGPYTAGSRGGAAG